MRSLRLIQIPMPTPAIGMLSLVALLAGWLFAATRSLPEIILASGVSLTLPFAIEQLVRLAPVNSRVVNLTTCVLRYICWPACACLMLALALPDLTRVLLLLGPFAIMTLLFAVRGIATLCREQRSTAVILSAMGQLYYPVAGLSLYVWKLEIELFDLPIGIIMLTSLHFHFAGLLLPILLAKVSSEFPNPIFNGVSLLAVLSIPLVGLGIAVSPMLECVSSLVLSILMMVFAGRQLYIAFRIRRQCRLGAGLLVISASALWLSMPLAIIYAYGEFRGIPRLQIPTMIAWHGSLNAIGFCGCGLLAWNLFDATLAEKARKKIPRPE